MELFPVAWQDSLAGLSMEETVHHLPEVTVTARRTREQDIYRNRSTSVAYYDVTSEMDDIYDTGQYVGENIHELLMNMNNNFDVRRFGINEFLYYKNRMIVFVVNYEQTPWNESGYFRYKSIGLTAVKSVYINESTSLIAQYIEPPPGVSATTIAMGLGGAVFIETWPEEETPAEGGKGVRKTWLEGYSQVKEFYSPDYSALPPEADYRRTLYWNPSVTPDETGRAGISFYNNSSCTNFSISAETVTPLGTIGIFRKNQAENEF